ncbi:MAG TPA: ribonuclease D [Planctomycetota bacterium]|nr:ribonuclease D [Planctomycetota bacterium]
MQIRNPSALLEIVAAARGFGSVAIDTEFIREKTYRPQLCLVQIATRDVVCTLDPFLFDDLSPLIDLVLDPDVEKVLHSGEQDMEIFFTLRRKAPRNIFDTQVAAALLGLGESISYARLVEDVLGVKLQKIETFTDWAQRPLTQRQVEYALDDVRYLYKLRDALEAEVKGLGRADWLVEELKFYEEASTYVKDAAILYKKVKGAARLEARELGLLRELAAWREEEAERVDMPRGRVILDESLVELARRAPASLEAVGAVRGVHPQLVRRSGEEIIRRVARGLKLSPAALPPPIERRASDEELSLVVDLLEVVLRSRAAENRIAPAYVATRKDLAELARRELRGGGPEDGEPLPILSGWRRRIAGEALVALLEGRSHLSIDRAATRVEVSERPKGPGAPS